MADTKITALTAITTVDPAADVLPIVDVSDTSMAASGTTKKITSNQILGAGGTATLASATITGDLTVDTSTLKVDSANDRVGIQSTILNSRLTIRAGTLAGIDIYRDDANANFSGIRFKGTTNSTVNGQIGWSGTQLRIEGTDEILCATNSSDRFRISSSGVFTFENVGGVAGTAMTLNASGLGVGVSPAVKLDIGGAATQQFRIQMSGQADTRIISDTGAGIIGTYSNHRLVIRTNSADAVIVDASQNVGIGVTPINRLTVAGNMAVGGTGNNGLQFHSGSPVSGNLVWWLTNDQANSNILNLYYYNAGVFSGRAFVVNQSGNFMVRTPSTPPTIPDNEMMVFNLTSNTNLRISVKGTDGTVRTANITLA